MGCGAEQKGDIGLLLPFLLFSKVGELISWPHRKRKPCPRHGAEVEYGAGLAQRPFPIYLLKCRIPKSSRFLAPRFFCSHPLSGQHRISALAVPLCKVWAGFPSTATPHPVFSKADHVFFAVGQMAHMENILKTSSSLGQLGCV